MPEFIVRYCKCTPECAGNFFCRSCCVDGKSCACERKACSRTVFSAFSTYSRTRLVFGNSPSILSILPPGLHSRARPLKAKVEKKNSVPLPASFLPEVVGRGLIQQLRKNPSEKRCLCGFLKPISSVTVHTELRNLGLQMPKFAQM